MIYYSDDEIRNKLREVMRKRGMSQVDLANATDTNTNKLSRMLNKEHLHFDEINKLCNALNCDLCVEIKPRDELDVNENAIDTLRRAINILETLKTRH